MGRHGGGSRSGGGSISSGSGDGVSTNKTPSGNTSSDPFRGCYNRSYYYGGIYHTCYAKQKNYGTSKSRLRWQIVGLVLMAAIMLPLFVLTASLAVQVGEKVDGDPERIMIQDTIDLLTPEEERRTLELFHEVYAASGMPVTLYTDGMEWKDRYSSIEIYSEELYYAMGMNEDAMIILFTYDGSFDWVYDIYCGEDTIQCLSDQTFEHLLDQFQKGMAGQNLSAGLDHAFHSVMDDFAKTHVDITLLGILVLIFAIYGLILYLTLIRPHIKERRVYQYFLEHPEMVNETPMLVQNQCPSCGAHNSNFLEVCEYCGTVLKI